MATGYIIAFLMDPVVVQVSDTRALIIFSAEQTWQQVAIQHRLSADNLTVVDEYEKEGARFVTVDWSEE